jgi:agmatinase
MAMIYVRSRCHAGLVSAPVRRHFHHPDFNARDMQGWRSLDAEGRLAEDGWRREQKWALDMGLPGRIA